MATDDGAKIPSPFDVRTIKDLVGLMSRHELSEIDLREGDLRIRLRRGPRGTVTVSQPLVNSVPPAPVATPAPPQQDTARAAKSLQAIKSPTPGTFYASPSPDAEAFVRVGSRVTPTTVVGIIEAMKILNEITADCSGVITEVLVDNQQPVEFGQVLFKVDPAG